MLTHAPLPAWLNLLKSLLGRSPSEAALVAPWHREGEAAGFLSRSAWSLALIAIWRQRSVSAQHIIVWVPDFFCNSSLVALRSTGAKLVFYPLTDKMSPDFEVCRSLASIEPPDIFVHVHYFGRPVPAAFSHEFCALHRAWLIEDAAHVLRPIEGVGNYGDYVLYSPHKHLPIPDGAVLVVRQNGPSQFGADEMESFGLPSSWPGQLGELQRQLGLAKKNDWSRVVVWLIKRLLQKFWKRPLRQPSLPFVEQFVQVHRDLAYLGIPTPSPLARRLLAGLLFNLGKVARQRQRNQLLWDALLLNNKTLSPPALSAAARPVNREWTPYLATYRAPDIAEATYHRWQSKHMPVTTWPDLPPEVVARPDSHAGAWSLRHSRLYLPVHQSLGAKAILDQCHQRGKSLDSDLRIRLVWEEYTRSQWEQWLAQVSSSNMLQSWAYGEAKAAQEGWHVRRGVFYDLDEPVAIVQALEKCVAGMLRVTRINRGPLFLSECSLQKQRDVMKLLATLGCMWSGRVLSISPELPLSGSSMILMEELGYRQFSPCAWESVRLDLQLGVDVLRKRLNGKWRNMLAFAEKAGLQLEIGSSDQLFEWMASRYQELMQEKHFSGIPIGLLRDLRRLTGAEDTLLVLRAMHEGEYVAGVCISRHGSTATYLLGWNGQTGRKLKASHFLLWQAIIYFKQQGLCWLDLGGINEDDTPGISAFKLGMNGEYFELVGDFWKW